VAIDPKSKRMGSDEPAVPQVKRMSDSNAGRDTDSDAEDYSIRKTLRAVPSNDTDEQPPRDEARGGAAMLVTHTLLTEATAQWRLIDEELN